jgi:Ca-activated chloride channel family protein
MGQMDANSGGRSRTRSGGVAVNLFSRQNCLQLLTLGIALLLVLLPLPTHSQSGRQNNNSNKTGNNRPSAPIADPANINARIDDGDEVVRVTSTLVPVPATIVDNHGVAVTNLKLEDFELRVDGQLARVNEISRAETPVRIAMLFDNSGSLTASREFEKHAATRFFQNVLRPVDQAAVYSISTYAELVQPMTADVRRLQQTIEGFGKPEGSTSLYDGIFAALVYLKPFTGRRVIIIVSDGRDTTSRIDHDFDATRQRLLGDECQIYIVQTGLYDNANVRDLAAERRMEEFALQTGGAVYIPRTIEDLDSAFEQIAADLAQQYILSYYPGEDKRDGRYHLISVRVKAKPDVRIRARKGFLVRKRSA